MRSDARGGRMPAAGSACRASGAGPVTHGRDWTAPTENLRSSPIDRGGHHEQHQSHSDAATAIAYVASCDMRLEVVTLPVADVDRAKRFYQSLGWRLDADIVRGDAFRAVQLTPPHSACSIAFGKGLTTGVPGSVKRLLLMVDDVDEARENVARRGVEVSEVFHLDGGRVPGRDPENRSYQSYAAFSDPDGNEWLLQEIKSRLPGREWED